MRLQSLFSALIAEVGTEGPSCGTDFLMTASTGDMIRNTTTSIDTFVLREPSVVSFGKSCGSTVKESIALLNIVQRKLYRFLILSSYFTVLQKVTRWSAQRTNSNGPATFVYSPILPSELVKFAP